MEQKVKGAMVRGKTGWVEHGEKNTRYFLIFAKKKIRKEEYC